MIGGETGPRIVIGHRRIVHAVDGYCDRAAADAPVSVADRVGEGLALTLAHSQPVEVSVGIVAECSVTVIGHVSQGAGRVEAADRKQVSIDVAVVVEHVRRDELAILVGGETGARIVGDQRRVVLAADGDRDGGVCATTVHIRDGVSKGIGEAFPDRQGVERGGGGRGVKERAVGVHENRSSQRAGRAGGESKRVVGVRIAGQRCQAVIDRHVFNRDEAHVLGRGGIVLANDRDRNRGRRLGQTVADRVVKGVGRSLTDAQGI